MDIVPATGEQVIANTLQRLVGDAWREWSDEAVGAAALVISCLEHIGFDNPPTWPVPFVRFGVVPPATQVRPLYVLRPLADANHSKENAS